MRKTAKRNEEKLNYRYVKGKILHSKNSPSRRVLVNYSNSVVLHPLHEAVI